MFVKDEWVVANCTFFFTEKAAQEFIEANNHNLAEPRIYVNHSYRNPEIKAIVDHLFEEAGVDLPRFWS